jgi:hypothetical protein
VRRFLPLTCLRNLYYAFVHPHIVFGIETYANTYKTYLNKLVKLNTKLIRILFMKKISTPTCEVHRTINVLSLPKLYELQLLVFVHKCIHHKYLLPDIFHDYFTRANEIHCHNTRRRSDMFVQAACKNIGQRCTHYKGSKLWNVLPSNLKVFSSTKVFKKNLKILLDHV